MHALLSGLHALLLGLHALLLGLHALLANYDSNSKQNEAQSARAE